MKERDAKSYRPKALDDRLRRERTRNEVRLLVEARKLGVRTPIVYDVDAARHRIVLEALAGETLKELLARAAGELPTLEIAVEQFGSVIGRLHAGGLSHGDLTSSNVIFPDGPDHPPALLDPSMGERSAGIEDRGIDLHLVHEDLTALHPKGERLWKAFRRGYAAAFPDGHAEVEKRAREIRGRVRYA